MQITQADKSIFDAMREGILLIDTDERIVFANAVYCRFIGMPMEKFTGMKLRELRPGARLPEVLVSGEPILHATRMEDTENDIYFVNMYPIKEDDKITGGLSVVTFMQEAFDASHALDNIKKRDRSILHRVNKNSAIRYNFDSIIAESPATKKAKENAVRAAATDASVLLLSESGTGKELYAQAIHDASERRSAPFVAVNCANFNETMMESELFGYVEGAFTGAKKGGKLGLLEAADGGTIFLDEVSEMQIPLQSKLLRFIQERRFRRVGSVEEWGIDVRIISASNADLQEYIRQGKFRSDLYYRLAQFQIYIPPLRERRLDIPVLTRVFLDEMSNKLHTSIRIADDAMYSLMHYAWPGNVRELRNVLGLAAYFAEDGVITNRALPEQMLRFEHEEQSPSGTLPERVRRFEQAEIQKLLYLNGDDLRGKKRTAKELGISLSSLYNKLGVNS